MIFVRSCGRLPKTGRDRLIVRRREDGLTLEEIAHELGVNKSTVKRRSDQITRAKSSTTSERAISSRG